MRAVDKVAVLTSGGDAPGMNAAIRAVVRKGIFHNLRIFGVYHGFAGLINGQITQMELGSVADIVHRGGTILKTARCKEMLLPEGQKLAADQLIARGIDALVAIGGDGTYRGAKKLAELGIKVVGIPGTIDNDINGTDFTIGFDTSVNTVVEAVSKLRDTATSHERVFVVEVMGRNCGDIALHAGLATGAESILIPEIPFDLEEISEKLRRGFQRGKNHSIIMVAEGAGNVIDIARQLTDQSGFENRVTILGHVQRGGSPSSADAVLAGLMGAKAVEALLEGQSEVMIASSGNEIVTKSLDIAFAPKPYSKEKIYQTADELAI
ncbi:6-phosphofructokinase [Syntrophobotulus glycolicus DSM 8271]|uniref:ATP-dependent 6-phosphofructokinase n=1 Tax=Syntrophobotulus glycolicus (strain DSM 8271 / FlGlyR) TaxID=645991 RepID=F0T222_SYNGF|nr:6-phosphofructokinase [Syntrophobotulus glycolicus]ADY56366.1 6-phosphofructokinase [Syntrophobotulus glycolicus DSM 8271]